MNLVKWEVSMPALQVFIGSAPTIAALALPIEMTFLLGALFI